MSYQHYANIMKYLIEIQLDNYIVMKSLFVDNYLY
jgi:hypothetical protein